MVFEKVLKDPVHDEIIIEDPWIWDVINTSAVQRLRRIRQLGTSYFTFHGAEHSRFTHSLGAYETMRRVLMHLEKESGWPLSERDRRLALAAALLHDIGHGPFSHTFESILNIHHEDWTRKMMVEDAELCSILQAIDADFPDDLVSIFEKSGRFPIHEQLISSQLDVDRMDYLLRDALHTGVTYGRFELTRLIRSFTIHQGRVVLKASALHTVEQYILARYFMYTQVYLHPVTVGSDVLVSTILRRARHLLQSCEFVFMPSSLKKLLDVEESEFCIEDYLRLDESTIIYAIHEWSESDDAVLADLSRRFLGRQLFAPVTRKEPSSSEWATIRTMARACGYDPDYYVTGRLSRVSAYVYRGSGIPILNGEGKVEELSRVSRMLKTLSSDEEYHIFVPKEMLERNDELGVRLRSLL